MLPNHVLSTTVESATFLPPKTGTPKVALIDYCNGGNAIGDPSAGLNVQVWEITTDGGPNVIFTPLTSGSPTTVCTAADTVVWVAGTFDLNMHPFVAYMLDTGSVLTSWIYWYNSGTSSYVTTQLPAGVTNPFCDLDDRRPLDSAGADIIVSYINGSNQLCFRAQRDLYAVEYVLATMAAGSLLTQAGMNRANRFQFQIQSLLPVTVNLFTKFAHSSTFKPILLANASGIEPRIWIPDENITVKAT